MKYKENKKNVNILLKDMKPNPKNPRKHYDNREMDQLKLSLQSLGQMQSCEIDEQGNLLKGHRRHYAATELGWKQLRCDIVVGLSPFEKSARMVADNVTHSHFNAWENRESIARIYWEEFVEEYSFKSANDKGYTTFAKKMGLSASYIKKIIETTSGENKKYFEQLKKAGVDADTTDEVLTAPKELRSYLTDVALRRKGKIKDMGNSSRVREYVRAAKRKAIDEQKDIIESRRFKIWFERIESIGFEFGDHILKNSEEKDLKKLEIVIRKNILQFYNKLIKELKKEKSVFDK